MPLGFCWYQLLVLFCGWSSSTSIDWKFWNAANEFAVVDPHRLPERSKQEQLLIARKFENSDVTCFLCKNAVHVISPKHRKSTPLEKPLRAPCAQQWNSCSFHALIGWNLPVPDSSANTTPMIIISKTRKKKLTMKLLEKYEYMYSFMSCSC